MLKTKMVKSNEQPVEKKESDLELKISSLKRNAFALIREVRELENISFLNLTRGIDLFEELRRFEVKLIRHALEETDGHQVRAAQLLGLKITTLNEKIKRYGIDPRENCTSE